ncbi:MAG: hypothetical protein AB1651_10705 [Pseudomonadota bacterium]
MNTLIPMSPAAAAVRVAPAGHARRYGRYRTANGVDVRAAGH